MSTESAVLKFWSIKLIDGIEKPCNYRNDKETLVKKMKALGFKSVYHGGDLFKICYRERTMDPNGKCKTVQVIYGVYFLRNRQTGTVQRNELKLHISNIHTCSINILNYNQN